MDLQQAKIVLNKINALYKNMSSDAGGVSSIEKDLMLSYIRQFYDAFLEGENGKAKPARVHKTPKVAPPPVVETPKVEPPKKEYKPPKIIEIPDSLKDLNQDTPAPPPPPPPKPKPMPKPTPKAAPKVEASANAVDIDSLIDFKEAKELSEKLSARPIRDLSKALSINDKLLFANELFGKNQGVLSQALDQLNQFNRFEEAIPALSELAGQFDWLDKEKKHSATEFIKLVKRRYA